MFELRKAITKPKTFVKKKNNKAFEKFCFFVFAINIFFVSGFKYAQLSLIESGAIDQTQKIDLEFFGPLYIMPAILLAIYQGFLKPFVWGKLEGMSETKESLS